MTHKHKRHPFCFVGGLVLWVKYTFWCDFGLSIIIIWDQLFDDRPIAPWMFLLQRLNLLLMGCCVVVFGIRVCFFGNGSSGQGGYVWFYFYFFVFWDWRRLELKCLDFEFLDGEVRSCNCEFIGQDKGSLLIMMTMRRRRICCAVWVFCVDLELRYALSLH